MKPQAIKKSYITEFVNSGMSQQEAEELWNKIDVHIDEALINFLNNLEK